MRDLLFESKEAAGIIVHTLQEVERRRDRYNLSCDVRTLAELYNALARALNIANRLSLQSLTPEEYSAEAIRKLLD